MAELMGKSLAKIHDGDVIHGDLTTSNMLLQEDTSHLVCYITMHSVSCFEKRALLYSNPDTT